MHFFRKLEYQYFLFKFGDDISTSTVLSAPDTECKIRGGVFICCQHLLIRVINGIVTVLSAFAVQRQSWRLYCQHISLSESELELISDIVILSICCGKSQVASLLSAFANQSQNSEVASLVSAFAVQSQIWRLYFQHLLIMVRSGIFIVSICLSESEVASLLSAFAHQSQKWHLYCQHLLIRVKSGIFILPEFAYQSQKGHLYYQHLLWKVVNRVFIVSIWCAKSEMGSLLLFAFAVQTVRHSVFIVSICCAKS
jgi:hypothetical protein